VIFALDCATKTGWAIIDKGKVIESGVQDFSKKRGESNGAMFLRARRWLMDMLINNHALQFDLVTYEQAHHRGGAATEVCVNLTGRVLEVAALVNEGKPKEQLSVVPYHTATIKKWATGKGTGDKLMMIARAERITGKKMTDDNEADAVLLGLLAWEEYGL
jgi:Holliday junction resolvasome RuvABC endonuclease subunit